jgi:hypothetical protein
MTGLFTAILIVLASLGFPGLDPSAMQPENIQPCSGVVTEGDGVPWSPTSGPDSHKISNGF